MSLSTATKPGRNLHQAQRANVHCVSWLAIVFSHPSLTVALGIAAKTVIVYLLLVLALRLLGTRELGELTSYDFVFVVVIANAVQNALVGGDNTLVGGLVSAAALLATNFAFTTLVGRVPGLKHRLVGEPILLFSDGQLHEEGMRRSGLTVDDLLIALREHGLGKLQDVKMAVLEVDGTISIVPQDATVLRTRHRFRGLRAS